MLAIVCPGQGSQTPGLLTPWIEDQAAAGFLAELSDYAGTDLTAHGTASDEDTIRDTAVAQPLIVAATLLSARSLGLSPERLADMGDQVLIAGHSVGEVPAAALAGVLSTRHALELIAVRANAMAESAAAAPSGMAAVLGGAEEEVLASIEASGLSPANVNGAGQIVAAGAVSGIDQLAENPPARARVIPLKVAGAFHTDYMAAAQQTLAASATSFQAADPSAALLSNRDGEQVHSGSEVLSRIVDQVTRPVRWDQCMGTMRSAGVTGVLELLPGGTLAGLAKRGLKGTKTLAVKSPDDLSTAAEFIAEHTS